ncbi:sodium-independent anion transporter [Rhizobium sp. 16-556-2B]
MAEGHGLRHRRRTARQHRFLHCLPSDDRTFQGLLIVRPEGRLFFVNAQMVADRIRELTLQHNPDVLMLDLSRVFDIEYTALQMLVESERNLAEHGVVLWFAGLNPDVLDYVTASGFAGSMEEGRMFSSGQAGISYYQKNRTASRHAFEI